MTGTVVAKMRAFLIRALAVVAVVGTYAATSVGTQILGAIGVTGVVLTTTATPAQAWHRGYAHRRWRRRTWRRYAPVRRRRWRRRW